MLYVNTIGSFAVSKNKIPVPFTSRKAIALFAFLLFANHKKQAREDVASLLWPCVEPRLARASLRQTVLELKRTLGPYDPSMFCMTKDEIWFERTHIQTDLNEVFDFPEMGSPAGVIAMRRFTPAAFLKGLENVSTEFGEWVFAMRTDLTRDFVNMCKAELEKTEHGPQMLFDVATILRRHDEFDEQAVRTMMSFLQQKNELPAALKVYNDLFTTLEHEMDAEPSLETQNLAVEIKLLGGTAAEVTAHTSHSAGPKEAEARIAIMPFDALGHEEPNKYVILGLLDEVTCRLARLQSMRVISSNSTRSYLGRSHDLSELSKALNVQYIVLGSIRRRLDRAAINVQIVDVQTQSVVDARVHECAYDNILSLNSEIAASIVNSILPNVSRAELARTRDFPITSLGPHLLVMRAKEKIFELTQSEFVAAGELLDQAIEDAPYFAPAFAAKADWHSIRIWQRWSDNHLEDSDALDVCARRALSLSGSEPRVMSLIGHNRVLMHQHFDEAKGLFEDALDQAPNDADVLVWTVPSLAFMGDVDQSMVNGMRALSLSPSDPFLFRIHHFLGIASYTAGEFERSVDYGLLCYHENPNYLSNIRMTVAAMNAAGRTGEIAPLLERHRSLAPDFNRTNYGDGPPFRENDKRLALIADLRSAGLPV